MKSPRLSVFRWLRSHTFCGKTFVELIVEFACKGINPVLILRPKIVGDIWREHFIHLAREQGMKAEDIEKKKQEPYDVMVNGKVRVQCKACNTNVADIRSRYPTERNDRTYKYLVSEVDVIAIVWRENHYYIPTTELADSDNPKFVKRKIDPSKFSRYRDNWSVFSDPPHEDPQPRQSPLFT